MYICTIFSYFKVMKKTPQFVPKVRKFPDNISKPASDSLQKLCPLPSVMWRLRIWCAKSLNSTVYVFPHITIRGFIKKKKKRAASSPGRVGGSDWIKRVLCKKVRPPAPQIHVSVIITSIVNRYNYLLTWPECVIEGDRPGFKSHRGGKCRKDSLNE